MFINFLTDDASYPHLNLKIPTVGRCTEMEVRERRERLIAFGKEALQAAAQNKDVLHESITAITVECCVKDIVEEDIVIKNTPHTYLDTSGCRRLLQDVATPI